MIRETRIRDLPNWITLLKKIMQRLVVDLKEAWNNVVELTPLLDKIETNPQFAQIVPPNETIALITMSIEIGSLEGLINICIPYILLEPILDKLNTRYWFTTSSKQRSKNEEEVLRNRILQTVVPLITELGSTCIPVKEIYNLHPGDVIKLDKNLNNLVSVKVGSNTKFKGEIGIVDKKMAVKIIEVIKEGEFVNDKWYVISGGNWCST